MSDRFQFYSRSADSAPGKGAGEVKPSEESYSALAAIPGWRKVLSNLKDKVLAPDDKAARDVLLATGNTELWSGKTRWVEGEALRAQALQTPVLQAQPLQTEAKRNVIGTTEMSGKVNKSRKNKAAAPEANAEAAPANANAQADATGSDTTINSPSAVSNGVTTNLTEAAPNVVQSEDLALRQEIAYADEVERTRDSSIRFCTVCNNYLYLHVDETTGDLQRSCRNCGYKDTAEQGGLVSEMRIEQLSAEGYNLVNEFTLRDPRLPHLRGTMKCVNNGCQSNKPGVESDIVYIKYDSENLRYMYVCTFCKTNWRSRR
jgi:DNA-directed RNA polymerase subunit M/transcription elongation factor TFIIS